MCLGHIVTFRNILQLNAVLNMYQLTINWGSERLFSPVFSSPLFVELLTASKFFLILYVCFVDIQRFFVIASFIISVLFASHSCICQSLL
jgi:hypothetical protein